MRKEAPANDQQHGSHDTGGGHNLRKVSREGANGEGTGGKLEDLNLSPSDVSPSQHAFIMLGDKVLFLCHMAMFDHEDHCYQLIVRATLPSFAMDRYREDLREGGSPTYFLGNSKRDELIVPEIASGARRSFSADIFRGAPARPKSEGWPWNGRSGFLVLGDVPVSVDRVLYCRHFDFAEKQPDHLTYVLFGEDDEAHLTHYAVPEPDFDHILSLDRAPEWLPKQKLAMGIHVTFPTLRTDPKHLCENPLTKGQEYAVTYYGQGTRRPIHVGRTWWFSAAIVNRTDPCAAASSQDEPHRH